ncbi:MAG: hypothetical protein ACSLFE_11825 [Gemmatimonadaceae bacterium]
MTGFDVRSPARCPVRGCSETLGEVNYRKSLQPFCAAHGIRLHSNTFVYWNGDSMKDEARLRNFPIRRDLAERIALSSVGKAETHRLGYEMSEDALTWNVLVAIAQAGKLADLARFLTGRPIDVEPQLYLWGKLVDVSGSRIGRYTRLDEIRRQLESDIVKFQTEPDAMLVADGQIVISIEAKFGSANPVAHEGEAKPGEKPTNRPDILRRYLDPSTSATKAAIKREAMGDILHTQLFRNVVFASEMADGCDWHVVNLVSTTQWARLPVAGAKGYSSANPEPEVSSYLHEDFKHCFTFRSWEQLHGRLVAGDAALHDLDDYMRSKSAHYLRAFDLV